MLESCLSPGPHWAVEHMRNCYMYWVSGSISCLTKAAPPSHPGEGLQQKAAAVAAQGVGNCLKEHVV